MLLLRLHLYNLLESILPQNRPPSSFGFRVTSPLRHLNLEIIFCCKDLFKCYNTQRLGPSRDGVSPCSLLQRMGEPDYLILVDDCRSLKSPGSQLRNGAKV